jgi:putative membrane protein
MTEKETEQQIKSRILILCVDRDGDIETKAGIKTPLQGRTANLDAAVSLALRDPEEPDANAMFEAVRLFDRLDSEKQPEESFEVATISGIERGGVGADRKLVAELGRLLDSFSADEVILVTDGYSDEAVLPLVESRVPVSSVRRIVVKHSESIEETAALFSRYMRLIWENPRYARIALGIPGLLVFLLGILLIFPEYVGYYYTVIVLILGGFLLFKGFGVDRAARNIYKWAREYSPPSLPVQISNYSIIAGVLCVAVSVYLGAISATSNVTIETIDFTTVVNALPDMAGYFIKGFMDLMVVGVGIVLFGRSIRLYFERDARLLRNVALVVSVAWSRWILNATADILIEPGFGFENEIFSTLVFTIVVGILIGIASVLLVIIIHRSTKDFFGETDEDVDKFEGTELAPSTPSAPPDTQQ